MKKYKVNLNGKDFEVIQDTDGKFIKPESVTALEKFGTALKPANEPIVVARKPLEKGLTVAENVQKWGTGAINIDGTRIATDDGQDRSRPPRTPNTILGNGKGTNLTASEHNTQGRWPANIILDEAAAEMLDVQTKDLHGAGSKRSGGNAKQDQEGGLFGVGQHQGNGMRFGDSGGASRFFYVAKASKRERNAGLEGMPEKILARSNASQAGNEHKGSGYNKIQSVQNHHPTVKPIKLMQYLITLVTPPNGTVLDPFMGSGSTGVAAKELGFAFVGIELTKEYFEIAKKRLGIIEKSKILGEKK